MRTQRRREEASNDILTSAGTESWRDRISYKTFRNADDELGTGRPIRCENKGKGHKIWERMQLKKNDNEAKTNSDDQ
jgi:hypothetical protein